MYGLDAPGASLALMIGPEIAVPAPRFVAEALDSVEVTHGDSGPSGFQLTFNADRANPLAQDYQLLLTRVLSPGIRVVIVITLANGMPRVLSDGFITHIQLSHAKASGGATISVTGEDVGVKMDLMEVSGQYPALGDVEIVELLLAKYALYGVIPIVIPVPTSLASDPLERVPVQNGTDRAHINNLAHRYGYCFMIRPGPVPLANTAYWGPPPHIGAPQSTLCVDMGPSTNVDSINFAYDALAPARYIGEVQDSETELDVPLATLDSLRIPLAAEPAMLFNVLLTKTKLFNRSGMTWVDAMAYAQGATDASADNVVTATGEVDTMVYGDIMDAPGLVAIRGAGLSYDGFYYVKSVTHHIKRGEYKQNFTLTREGLMPLSPIVPP